MVEYPWNWNYGKGTPAQVILQTFFEKQNLTPSWTDCDYVWGGFNETTGLWTGALGEVIFRKKKTQLYPMRIRKNNRIREEFLKMES